MGKYAKDQVAREKMKTGTKMIWTEQGYVYVHMEQDANIRLQTV